MLTNIDLISKLQQARLHFANLMDEYVDSFVFSIDRDEKLADKVNCIYELIEALEFQIRKGYLSTDEVTIELYEKIDCLTPIYNTELIIDTTLIQPFISNTTTLLSVWGGIGGDINNQTDLINLLNLKQNLITLTTTGTSGAATFNQATGALNIPEYQGGVTSFNTRTGAITLTSEDVTTALGFTPENVANKSIDANLGTSDDLYPSQKAVKSYVDAQVAGATIPDATTTVKGKIQLAGDLSGTADAPTVPALEDKEELANKSDNTALGTSATLYPTQNAVKTYVDNAVSSATIPDATTTVKGKIKLAGDLGGTADLPTVPALDDKEDLANKSTDINLGTSDILYPTQNAVKTYIDNNIFPSTSTRTVQTFTSTAGQTTFTIVGTYTVGQLDVFVNGARQNETEYTASNGSTVVFDSGLVVGDIVDLVIYNPLNSLAPVINLDTSGFGEDIAFNATTSTLTIDKYDWMALVRGYTVIPTLFSSTATAEVYEYVYTSTTLYRKILIDGTEDAFYSESGLTNKLCDKKITL